MYVSGQITVQTFLYRDGNVNSGCHAEPSYSNSKGMNPPADTQVVYFTHLKGTVNLYLLFGRFGWELIYLDSTLTVLLPALVLVFP